MKMRTLMLCSMFLMAASLAAAQTKKTAEVIFESDAPYEHYRYGHKNFKIDGQVKSFGWGDETQWRNERKANAYDRGAVWRIVYGNKDGELFLWSATFLGRISNSVASAKPVKAKPAKSAKPYNACKFCGTWKYYRSDAQIYFWLRISEADSGQLRFEEGSMGVGGQIYWPDFDVANADAIYLRMAGQKLTGSFRSINFRPTSGSERNYQISCELLKSGKVRYIVRSAGFAESYTATKQ